MNLFYQVFPNYYYCLPPSYKGSRVLFGLEFWRIGGQVKMLKLVREFQLSSTVCQCQSSYIRPSWYLITMNLEKRIHTLLIMAVRVVEFSSGGYKIRNINQYTQRKLLNFAEALKAFCFVSVSVILPKQNPVSVKLPFPYWVFRLGYLFHIDCFG